MAHIPCGNQSKPKLRFPLYEYPLTIRFSFQHIKEITQLVERNTEFGPNQDCEIFFDVWVRYYFLFIKMGSNIAIYLYFYAGK